MDEEDLNWDLISNFEITNLLFLEANNQRRLSVDTLIMADQKRNFFYC